MGDLADGVRVGVGISRPLANVVTAESGVSQMSSISSVSTVADGSISRNMTVSIVN